MMLPRIPIVASAATVVAFTVALSFGQAEPNNLLKPGTPAPIFSLPGIDGNRTALRAWCGDTLSMLHINKVKHTVIVSFWATWCKPCQKEIPQIMAYMAKHKADPVKVFFISIDKEGVLTVRPHLQDNGWVDMPALLDPYAKTAERYGVKSLPALFVIDPNGIVRYAASGFEEGTDLSAKLDNVLADIAAGRSVRGGVETGGQSVSAAGPAKVIPPKDRWRAVMRVECGDKAETVAQEVGVDKETLYQWHEDLKKAAMNLWGDK
jgi:cytochrome c biogenesis protein CcmG, thiol:disulfide interchange protein DsbE